MAVILLALKRAVYLKPGMLGECQVKFLLQQASLVLSLAVFLAWQLGTDELAGCWAKLLQ
jgi:hypothetical protein